MIQTTAAGRPRATDARMVLASTSRSNCQDGRLAGRKGGEYFEKCNKQKYECVRVCVCACACAYHHIMLNMFPIVYSIVPHAADTNAVIPFAKYAIVRNDEPLYVRRFSRVQRVRLNWQTFPRLYVYTRNQTHTELKTLYLATALNLHSQVALAKGC